MQNPVVQDNQFTAVQWPPTTHVQTFEIRSLRSDPACALRASRAVRRLAWSYTFLGFASGCLLAWGLWAVMALQVDP